MGGPLHALGRPALAFLFVPPAGLPFGPWASGSVVPRTPPLELWRRPLATTVIPIHVLLPFMGPWMCPLLG